MQMQVQVKVQVQVQMHVCSVHPSRYTSDMFSLLGTIILWVYWPRYSTHLLLVKCTPRFKIILESLISI